MKRRSFLGLLGLATVAPAVARLLPESAPATVSLSPVDDRVTGLREGCTTYFQELEPMSPVRVGDVWLDGRDFYCFDGRRWNLLS